MDLDWHVPGGVPLWTLGFLQKKEKAMIIDKKQQNHPDRLQLI